MCLSFVQKKTKIKSGTGYMVRKRCVSCSYRRKRTVFQPLFHSYPEGIVGETLETDPKIPIYTSAGLQNVEASTEQQMYLPAFHIFRFKKDALSFLYEHCITGTRYILKVSYDDVVCAGHQDKAPVVVAKRVKYLKMVKKVELDFSARSRV